MGKKREIQFHLCMDCSLAHLIQWADDPIIAECKRNGERQVATTPLPCLSFKKRMREPEIEHKKKRLGITDKYI